MTTSPIIAPYRAKFMSQYSPKTRSTYEFRFNKYLNFLKNLGVSDATHVKSYQVEKWGRSKVEPMKVRKDTKERYWSLIRQYYEFLEKNHIIPGDQLNLPTMLEFTDYMSEQVIDRQNKDLPELFEIIRIIKHAKMVNTRMFIYLVLMVFNGARDSEIRSIKLENIHDKVGIIRQKTGRKEIPYTYFQSGVVERHKKKGQVFYFVPKLLRNSMEWKMYLEQIHEHKNPVYLFQTSHFRSDNPRFISDTSTYRNLNKYAKKCGYDSLHWGTHIFRDVLNEIRLHMQCPSPLQAILLNQAPKGANATFYLKKCRRLQHRYVYWKKYTPDDLYEVFRN